MGFETPEVAVQEGTAGIAARVLEEQQPNTIGGGKTIDVNPGQVIENGKLVPNDGTNIKDANMKELEEFMKKKPADGVTELPTGDTLVRDEGRQILFMPNGDKLTIHPSGAYDLKAQDGVRVTSKGGTTRLEYPNGDSVVFDEKGLLSIQRDGMGVAFGRRSFPGLIHPNIKEGMGGGTLEIPPIKVPKGGDGGPKRKE